MASRWRNWDMHFHIEVLEQEETKNFIKMLKIIPVGSRGKVKLNVPPYLLTLPEKTVTKTEKLMPVSGRGRRLKSTADAKSMYKPEPKIESIEEFSKRLNKENNISEREWPSLFSGGVGKTKSNTSKKPISNHIKLPDNLTYNLKKDIDSVSMISENQFNDYEDELAVENNLEDGDELRCDKQNGNLVVTDVIPGEQNKQQSNYTNEQLDLRDNDYTNIEFLKKLENPEQYVLIENLPLEFDEVEFQETIISFGDISLFLLQPSQTFRSMNALVKMDNPSHCDWVVSCLDGSTELCGESGVRLSVLKVEDLLLEDCIENDTSGII